LLGAQLPRVLQELIGGTLLDHLSFGHEESAVLGRVELPLHLEWSRIDRVVELWDRRRALSAAGQTVIDDARVDV